MSVEVTPVEGLPEVRPHDDLAELLARPLAAMDVRAGDALAVTQKIVSKAEGRVVPEEPGVRGPGSEPQASGAPAKTAGRAAWIERETSRVVARRDDLVIAETRHGFVCANAGVDASNVEAGFLTLLPEDPDASAERLRSVLSERLGVDLAIVVTDTFGRPWRQGLVNVAIGCAGMPALVDLRGSTDHHGRELEATVVALADEVAAASGLVMGKSARVPAALVRGVGWSGASGSARDLVRPPAEDLFRESPLVSISARRTIRSFGEGDVPMGVVEEAVRAAATAPAPHHTRPWRFTCLTGAPAKRALLAAMADAWRADLVRDGITPSTIERRLARSDAVLGTAPLLVVPWVSFGGAHAYPDAERRHAEQEMFLLSAGAAIQNLLLAFHAQGFASCWTASTLFCQEETRAVLGMDEGWFALGTVAVGPMPTGAAPPARPPIDLWELVRFR